MVVIVVQDIYGKKRIKRMEKSKRPIKRPEEETVVTLSKEELINVLGKASCRITADVADDDIEIGLVLISLLAKMSHVVVDEIFGEDED